MFSTLISGVYSYLEVTVHFAFGFGAGNTQSHSRVALLKGESLKKDRNYINLLKHVQDCLQCATLQLRINLIKGDVVFFFCSRKQLNEKVITDVASSFMAFLVLRWLNPNLIRERFSSTEVNEYTSLHLAHTQSVKGKN